MLVIPFTTGCTNDNMEDIEIVVTNYPNEYIVSNNASNTHIISPVYTAHTYQSIPSSSVIIFNKWFLLFKYTELFIPMGWNIR